ncbi:malectin domain-containing carbohydrate-binding protein [Phnomibacter sp. MR]|uniref:malectin domain-containing carbohydrate-binding protein n=1 Tax=Phnomibacter sp. MR TaxID=3042318 RepID=UPI003A80E2CD
MHASVYRTLSLCCIVMLSFSHAHAQRSIVSLNQNWHSIATSKDSVLPANTYAVPIDKRWQRVSIPHNWDQYEGYRRMLHGNRHGDSWYRKTFTIKQAKQGKLFFLQFEGVGSYATVYVNKQKVGEHAGGRTTFSIDISNVIKTDGTANELAVRAWHPSGIANLPWVCGGCSDERGFSEGSQPMGIFRPVQLLVTSDVRIMPFGIHAWADVQSTQSLLNINTTLKNFTGRQRRIAIMHALKDATGKTVQIDSLQHTLQPHDSVSVLKEKITVTKPELWSTQRPYLYSIVTSIKEGNQLIDEEITSFGFRTVAWNTASHQFVLNGQPLFINGIAEYEHLLGQSHAFSAAQIQARFKWIQAAGFNAFRDGHQPHNLLYGQLCDSQGILWWTQLSAHVWYDTPEFRHHFKQLLKEWVIERRNNPSVVMWGLQNESKLPEDFAKECTELIRSLDPTASIQRPVTTCNGGTGTDWDVPQNWTGTYGGNPAEYGQDLKRQILVGEYGAWRTLDLHTEGGFMQNGPYSEDRFTELMEQKVRLAESVKDSVAGHFFWLLTSHDNPGRVQGGEGLRELDRIGPVNYKGMLTPWEEPTDVYYMFRSNYTSNKTDPMVYIASHTWPNRWMMPGIKNEIKVYSNCDEVELFNDAGKSISLGKKKRGGIGTHFQWDSVLIQNNNLYAVGYVHGKVVTSDSMQLFHLPAAPIVVKPLANDKVITQPIANQEYVYRINCGGPDYTDVHGNTWYNDKRLAKSWPIDFPEIPAVYASQRRFFTAIRNTSDDKLFQTFRYGKNKLQYELEVPAGEYTIELFFTEPWLGIGGGINAARMRLFDVAINGKTVVDDLDIWKAVGTNAAYKKTVHAKAVNGQLIISFPESKVGQALIAAIAVSKKAVYKSKQQSVLWQIADPRKGKWKTQTWMDIGDKQYADSNITIHALPPQLFGADWIQFRHADANINAWYDAVEDVDLFVGIDSAEHLPADWKGFENVHAFIVTDEQGGKYYKLYRKRLAANEQVKNIPSRYFIASQPVNKMQPAYDLKPITQYRTNIAIVDDNSKKQTVNGRECVVPVSDALVSITWPVQTGVGDRYSFTVKYFWDKEPVQGRLLLLDAGGNRMMDESVSFTFTRTGKWNQFTVNTPSQINAGNYKVVLQIEQAKGLAISGIDVQ